MPGAGSNSSSRVMSSPHAMRASATWVPGGRLDTTPNATWALKPTAHPKVVLANRANAVTWPERNPDRIADPTTRTAALRRIDRPPTPDTVKNATMATISSSMGSVWLLWGSVLVNAVSTSPR